MFTEGDKVKIKATGLVGEIVDVRPSADTIWYTVESDEKYAPGGYGDIWPLFDCAENEIEAVK